MHIRVFSERQVTCTVLIRHTAAVFSETPLIFINAKSLEAAHSEESRCLYCLCGCADGAERQHSVLDHHLELKTNAEQVIM